MSNEDKTKTMKSEIEQEFETALRTTLEQIPILMLADMARIIKNVTDNVCDEYIKKSEDYQKAWALNIVRQMMSGEQPSKLEGEDK